MTSASGSSLVTLTLPRLRRSLPLPKGEGSASRSQPNRVDAARAAHHLRNAIISIRLDFMRLSSLADYAVVMMTAAARHCGGIARLNATVLAEETGVPLPTAQKLVSRLSAAGLLESTRGTGGGFRLSRPPASISLADIIEAEEERVVEGHVQNPSPSGRGTEPR